MIKRYMLTLGLFLCSVSSLSFAQSSTDVEAGNDARRILLPVTPEELIEAKAAVFENEQANSRSVMPVEPHIGTELFNLNSVKSVKIFTRPGHQTSITFLDITGKPWPFLFAMPGNSGFTVIKSSDTIDKGEKQETTNQHTMTISPAFQFAQSNLTIRLHETQQPIVFTLVDSSSSRVDYSRVFKINRVYSAGGVSDTRVLPKLISESKVAKDSAIEAFITGVPDGAVSLTTSHADVRAWSYKNKFYIRTIYDLTENYSGIAYGVDSLRVYELEYIDTKLFFLRYGDPLGVEFKEDELVDVNLSGVREYD
jgi:intracellular multiplication protein IcmK